MKPTQGKCLLSSDGKHVTRYRDATDPFTGITQVQKYCSECGKVFDGLEFVKEPWKNRRK